MTKPRSVAATANDNSIPGSRIEESSISSSKLEGQIPGSSLEDGTVSASKLEGGITDGLISNAAAIRSEKLSFLFDDPAAVPTSVRDQLSSGFVSVKTYGAIGDNTLHKLSERFSTLGEAQAAFPFVTSLDQSIDWAAIQKCVNENRLTFVPFGQYIVNETIVLNSPCYEFRGESLDTEIKYQPITPGGALIENRTAPVVSNFILTGPGSGTGTNEVGINLDTVPLSTKRRSVFSGLFVREFNRAGMVFSGQWIITVDRCVFLKCGVRNNDPNQILPSTGGIVFKQALSNWAGSGNIISNTYFAGCPYGIYDDSSWNMLIYMCFFETNNYGFRRGVGGSEWTVAHCWDEANTFASKIEGSIIVIGGRGISNPAITNANIPNSAMTRLTSSGIKIQKNGATPVVELTGRYGLLLTSPNGTQFRVTVDDSGNLGTASI